MEYRFAMLSRVIDSASVTSERATPAAPAPTGPARAMNISLGILRRLILDHMRQLGDVKPTRRHVRGHEKPHLVLSKTLEDPLPGRPETGPALNSSASYPKRCMTTVT